MKVLKRLGIVAVLCIVAVGIYIYPKASMYMYGKEGIASKKAVTFYVSTNATLDAVLNDLKTNGIINDVSKFKDYAAARNLKQTTLEPGKYSFTKDATLSDVLEALRKGNGEREVKVTFTNARTKKDLAEKIAANIELEPQAILDLITDDAFVKSYGFTQETINTMFIPNTYNVYWDVSAKDLIAKMAKEYKRFWNAERKQKAKNLGMSQTEVSILASIVTCETIKLDEAPMIAGVYVNRIKRGIPLDADPTLIWILGDFTIKRVLNKDKELDSPYNTYKNLGLPPGPIYIPSTAFIDAVLDYKKHDYIFFCAKEDFSGYSNFAKTNRQHNINARKYREALNKRNIYR